jgi:hypothetical protein
MRQSFCLFIFYHLAISFSSSSTSYRIWSCCQSICLFISVIQLFLFLSFIFISNMKAMSIYLLIHFFIIQLFLFSFLQLHIEYEVVVNRFPYSFLSFSYFFFSPSFSYSIWNRCQSICLFVFSHSAISFSFPSTSYRIWNRWQSICLFISVIQLFLFLSFIFISNMKAMSIYLLIHFYHLAISFPCRHFHIEYENDVNLFPYSFSRIHLFLFPLLHFHIEYEIDVNLFPYSFLSFNYFFLLAFNFILDIKSSQCFALFILFYLAISFSFPSFSYWIWKRCQSICLFIENE